MESNYVSHEIVKLNHASLFSGIGGFDLAAEWMGWDNVFHCEKNEFCQKVLKYYWPNAKCYEDITKTDFTIWRGRIDVLTGGFPCQPYSTAGKQLGTEDERHLWPEMLRAIREIQPTWIVGENVRGLVSWNGGLVFEQVQVDLEAEGYEVQPFLLPAAGVGAPHKRYRVWFIAFNSNYKGSCSGFRTIQRKNEEVSKWNDYPQFSDTNNEFVAITKGEQSKWMQSKQQKISKQEQRKSGGGNSENVASNTNIYLCKGRSNKNESKKTIRHFSPSFCNNSWQNFPTQSPVCGGNDGLPTELDGITFSKWRNESIKGYGNAVVPEIPFRIFQTIKSYCNASNF